MCSRERCSRLSLMAQGAEEGWVPGEEAGMELAKEGVALWRGRVSGHHSGCLRKVCQKRCPSRPGVGKVLHLSTLLAECGIDSR